MAISERHGKARTPEASPLGKEGCCAPGGAIALGDRDPPKSGTLDVRNFGDRTRVPRLPVRRGGWGRRPPEPSVEPTQTHVSGPHPLSGL